MSGVRIKLAEAPCAEEGVAQYQQGPPFTDNAERLRQRAVHMVERLVFHGRVQAPNNRSCILWFHHATLQVAS